MTSVHGSIPLPHRAVNLAGGLKALPSNLRHPLDRHQNGVLKFHAITHLLVTVEAGKNALDNLCSADVADEVLVDGIVDLFERGFFIVAHGRPLAQNARGEHLTTILNRTEEFSRRRNFQSCNASHADNSNQLRGSFVSRDPLRGEMQFIGGGDALPANGSNTSERHKNRAPDFKNIIARSAAINPHARPLDQFSLANLGDEKLGWNTWFNHFWSGRFLGRVHKTSPLKKNADLCRGIHRSALVHALRGFQRNHTISNHAKTIASAIPAAIASIRAALSDIQKSFAFVGQFSNSNQSPLRFAVAPALAAISVARPTLAGADRVGV